MSRKISAAVAAIVLFASANAAQAKDTDKLGKGDYFVFSLPGHPMTQAQFDLLQPLDTACRDQAKRQNPSALKVVALTAVRTAPPVALFGGAAAAAGNFVPKGSAVTATDYGVYNGVAAIGSSIAGGINAYEMGKHATIAGCMISMVNAYRAFTDGDRMYNLVFAYNTFPVRGHPINRSQLTAVDSGDAPSPTAQNAAATQTVPPPPSN